MESAASPPPDTRYDAAHPEPERGAIYSPPLQKLEVAFNVAAPIGNTNGAKKQRLIADCLKRELTQNPEQVLGIAKRIIEGALAGESAALQHVLDRVDGKVPQPLVGEEGEAPITFREILIRAIDAIDDRPAEESK